MNKSALAVGLGLTIGGFAVLAFAQHSPAPDGPAESGLKTNRGGVHPPSPSDGTRFSPNPPPPLPGTVETPPAGKVKTEEKVGTPNAASTPAATPNAGAGAKTTPTAAAASATTPAGTPKAGRTKRPAASANPKPKPKPSPAS